MREEVLAAVLAADNSLSRDEPEVAANIGQQLEHMGLTTWSISVRRRIRDSVARLEPKKIIQTGASIGHLTAWIFDHFEGKDGLEEFQIIEEGNRFAVILSRLRERYSSVPSSIVVGMPTLLTSELKAWNISKIGDPPMIAKADAIIVDATVFTKNPRIKYTPSLTEKEVPVEVAFVIEHLANWLFADILVFKNEISDKVIKFSPS